MRRKALVIGLGLTAVASLVAARGVAFLTAQPGTPPPPAMETVPSPAGPGDAAAGPELLVLRTELRDDSRGKSLPVRIVFPIVNKTVSQEAGGQAEDAAVKEDAENATAPGPLPLIVFSHGMYGSGENLDPLAHHWASDGFVVILPTHADSLSLRTRGMSRLERLRLAREMRDNGARDLNTQFQAHWADRPRDVSLILDSLDTIEELDERLAGRIDRDRIGVGGHSFGAMTTMLIGGAEPINVPRRLERELEQTTGRGRPLADERVKCLVMISPQGISQRFGAGSWDDFDLPALTISGDLDRGTGGQPAAWRRHAFDLGHAGSHALVWIENAAHHFGGINGNTGRARRGKAPNADHVKAVQDATLVMWRAALRGDETDAAAIAERLEEALDGQRVTVEYREGEAGPDDDL